MEFRRKVWIQFHRQGCLAMPVAARILTLASSHEIGYIKTAARIVFLADYVGQMATVSIILDRGLAVCALVILVGKQGGTNNSFKAVVCAWITKLRKRVSGCKVRKALRFRNGMK